MNFIIAYAVLLHLIWGISILWDPSAAYISGAAELSWTLKPFLAGLSFIAAGLLALSAIIGKPRLWKALVALPQQVLLLISCVGAVICMNRSAFADGVVRPHAFIIADQSPILIVTLLHGIAVFQILTRVNGT